LTFLAWIHLGGKISDQIDHSFLCRQASLKARNELLQCLKLDSNDNKIRISQIVAQLVSTGSPFDERLLGGGPWMVVYTEGVFLWQIYTSPGKILLGKKNVASQSFNPITKGVLNSGEIAKRDCYVTAVGKYQQTQDNRTHLPVDIEVEVSSGILHIFDRKIPLPIKGRGKFTVCYLDDTLRIFRSQGRGLSVQVKQSYFLDHRLGLE